MERLKALYDAYVDTFRLPDGSLPVMMQLKYTHTMMVVRNAELIAEGEKFTDEERCVALAAALLHDTGRYEQLKRYNTFKDSDSVDHAVLSHDIVKSHGWLDQLPTTDYQLSTVILSAILFHNRRDLPENLDPLTLIASHTVRDADKLDIFRVLEDQIAHCDWRKDTRAFWNLALDVTANSEVVEAIKAGRPVDYNAIKSLADFVLIQVGWIRNGLHFETSRRICRDRGHLDFRRRFLAEIHAGPAALELCK